MSGPLPLPVRLDMATAADLQAALISRGGEPLVLDASQVRTAGTPALQVLLAAARSWRNSGHSLTIEDPSSNLLDLLSTAGLTLQDIENQQPEINP